MSATSTAGPLIFPAELTNGQGLAPKVMQPIPASTASYTIGTDFVCKTSHDSWLIVQTAVLQSRPAFTIHHFKASVPFHRIKLSDGGVAIYKCPNAGGGSERSEAISFEVLHRCFHAQLVKTEMEIEYEWSISKKTDYSVRLFGLKPKVGVSVTRGIKFEWGLNAVNLSLPDAMNLLRKKLHGVIMSTKDVVENDRWGQQMLHLFTPNRVSADKLQIAYDTLLATEPDLVSNTIVLVTIATKAEWIFTQGRASRYKSSENGLGMQSPTADERRREAAATPPATPPLRAYDPSLTATATRPLRPEKLTLDPPRSQQQQAQQRQRSSSNATAANGATSPSFTSIASPPLPLDPPLLLNVPSNISVSSNGSTGSITPSASPLSLSSSSSPMGASMLGSGASSITPNNTSKSPLSSHTITVSSILQSSHTTVTTSLSSSTPLPPSLSSSSTIIPVVAPTTSTSTSTSSNDSNTSNSSNSNSSNGSGNGKGRRVKRSVLPRGGNGQSLDWFETSRRQHVSYASAVTPTSWPTSLYPTRAAPAVIITNAAFPPLGGGSSVVATTVSTPSRTTTPPSSTSTSPAATAATSGTGAPSSSSNGTSTPSSSSSSSSNGRGRGSPRGVVASPPPSSSSSSRSSRSRSPAFIR